MPTIVWEEPTQFKVDKKEGYFLILPANPLIAFPIKKKSDDKGYVALLRRIFSVFEGHSPSEIMIRKGLPETITIEGYSSGTIQSLHDYLSTIHASLVFDLCVEDDIDHNECPF